MFSLDKTPTVENRYQNAAIVEETGTQRKIALHHKEEKKDSGQQGIYVK